MIAIINEKKLFHIMSKLTSTNSIIKKDEKNLLIVEDNKGNKLFSYIDSGNEYGIFESNDMSILD